MTQPDIPIVPGEPTQRFGSGPPVVVRRIHPLSIILAAFGAVATLIGMVSCVAVLTAPSDTAAGPSPSPVLVYTPSPIVRYVMPTPIATVVRTTAPAASITDGVWTVGVDIPAGRYRTTTNVVSGCYWKITKSGTNGNDIIANDLPSGGRPQVTLRVGQDFESNNCGTWAKI